METSNSRERGKVSGPSSSGPAPLILPHLKSDKLQGDALAEELQKPRDFCIKVEDQTIHVHKGVLCAVSDYFHAMLESGMKESDEGELRIQHTRADVIKTMIGYFYGEDTRIEWKQIRNYLDVVELWQLTQVKHVLEAYIAENILLRDCIEWFLYADAYHMEHVVLTITKRFLNTQFMEISRTKDFQSLSLSELISLISNKEVIHSVPVLEGCIRWIQEDESSRKHDVSMLLSHIRFNECNPAYVKHMLKTYRDSLITDQATQAHIQEVIAASFILIGAQGCGRNFIGYSSKVFCVNISSHTVREIGNCPECFYRIQHHLCCNTDSGIFYCPGSSNSPTSECRLLDLVTLKAITLPSLPNLVYCKSAVAMGSKIFMIGDDALENERDRGDMFFWYLDLQDGHWTKCCQLGQHFRCAEVAYLVSVDSFIFYIGVPLLGCNEQIILSCYDVEKKTWSERAGSPHPSGGFPRHASCVVINKDIYYVDTPKYTAFCQRYSTINNEWTTLAPPSRLEKIVSMYCHAVCV